MIATNIDFAEKRIDNCDSWTAYTKRCRPDTITIVAHPIWLDGDEERVDRLVLKMLSHEPIHQILWRYEGEAGSKLDIGRRLFLDMFDEHEVKELAIII